MIARTHAILRCLVVVCLASLVVPAAIAADDSATKGKPFRMEKYEPRLTKGSNESKLRALAVIRSQYAGETSAIDLLTNAGIAHLDATETPDVFLDRTAEALGQCVQTNLARITLLDWYERAEKHPLAANWSAFRVTCLRSLRRYDHADVHALAMRLINDPTKRVDQILAIDLLGIQNHEPALQPLIALTESDAFRLHYGLRFAVLDAISRYQSIEAINALHRMRPQLSGQLARLVALRLARDKQPSAPAGSDRHSPPPPQPGQIRVAVRSLRSNSERTPDRDSQFSYTPTDYSVEPSQTLAFPTFFGLPIYGDRVTFVIDCSSSMQQPMARNRTRLQVAKTELAGAINALSSKQAFRVITFNDRMRPLSPTLVDAIPTTKRNHVERIASLRSAMGTNLFGGLMMAMTDDGEPETIMLLSDGLPTRGRLRYPDDILRAVRVENTHRKISISTVAIGTHNQLMKALAEQNAGAHRAVR